MRSESATRPAPEADPSSIFTHLSLLTLGGCLSGGRSQFRKARRRLSLFYYGLRSFGAANTERSNRCSCIDQRRFLLNRYAVCSA